METVRQRRGVGENIIFALGVFVVFILVFESRLSVPLWLRPLGRMHPVILHLPIVVLLLAMALELFRKKKVTTSAGNSYEKLTSHLMFAGVILSGLTVIMGVFLAREDRYNEEQLLWHKWSGVAVFFCATIIFAVKDHRWYQTGFARIPAAITVVALVIAGNSGASLTHGKNFILQPVSDVAEPVLVPLEEARAFEHVIRPVLQSKCVSCHNEDKRKGKLLLTDSSAVVRGGKNGGLFSPPNGDSSLLLKRIYLPLDHKKHMPPADKPQLTRQEIALLHHWIRSGAPFSDLVATLPESDTFRMLAARFVESRFRSGNEYSFPEVARRTLERLNSNYRVIRPVSEDSPALTVNIYDRNVYSTHVLEELKDVRDQVITLNAAWMPVSDADLKHIARLTNLRQLNLNFTEVTAKGLGLLHPLQNLSNLSIAGTAMRYEDLRISLAGFPALRSVAAWDCGLSSEETEKLRAEFPGIEFPGDGSADETNIKLNPPRLKNKVRVFNDSIEVDLFHPVHGVDVRFTLDGADPDSITSPRFSGRTVLRETKAIKARAYKDGWLSSDVSTLDVYRCALKPDTVILLSKLNRVHPANGARTFFDQELGSFNANSPAWANNWAGFIRNDMELLLHYKSPVTVKSVALNMLIEIETSIFPPSEVEVWGGESPQHLRLIKREKIKLPTAYRKPYIELLTFGFEPQQVSYLKLIARPVMKLASWHKNKEKPAFILIDEILVN